MKLIDLGLGMLRRLQGKGEDDHEGMASYIFNNCEESRKERQLLPEEVLGLSLEIKAMSEYLINVGKLSYLASNQSRRQQGGRGVEGEQASVGGARASSSWKLWG